MNLACLAITVLMPLAIGGNSIRKLDSTFYQPDIEKFCRLELTCNGTGGPIIPVQLPKGRDGIDGKQGPAGPQGPPGPPGPSPSRSPDARPSAFTVRLTNFESDDDVLMFDSIETNVGDDYNKDTGKYRAPRSGTYFFSISVAAEEGKEASVEVRRDYYGYIGRVWANGVPGWTTASNSFIVHLNQGQTVWVKQLKQHYYLNDKLYNSFGGHVLFYD